MIGLILGLVWAGTTRFAEVPAFLAVATTMWTVGLVGGLIGIAKRVEGGSRRCGRRAASATRPGPPSSRGAVWRRRGRGAT